MPRAVWYMSWATHRCTRRSMMHFYSSTNKLYVERDRPGSLGCRDTLRFASACTNSRWPSQTRPASHARATPINFCASARAGGRLACARTFSQARTLTFTSDTCLIHNWYTRDTWLIHLFAGTHMLMRRYRQDRKAECNVLYLLKKLCAGRKAHAPRKVRGALVVEDSSDEEQAELERSAMEFWYQGCFLFVNQFSYLCSITHVLHSITVESNIFCAFICVYREMYLTQKSLVYLSRIHVCDTLIVGVVMCLYHTIVSHMNLRESK